MEPALLLQGVSKRYADHVAVDDLSVEVPPGTIYGILGPNGAGKSSTLRMAMNIIGRDSGQVRILGVDPAVDRTVLRRVGYLPEERGLYRKMRVLDVVTFFGKLKGMDAAAARREGEMWLDRMGLADWRRSRVEALSKGMQQKVQFIATVLHRPALLVLDEPASGLDPVNQEVLKETILDARRDGRTVIFSTHNMTEAEQLCESVCIIAQGKKVLDGNLKEIRRSNRGNRWRVQYEEKPAGALAIFSRASSFEEVKETADGWEFEMKDGAEPQELMNELSRLNPLPNRFERVERSLHEIFVERVGAQAVSPRKLEVAHA
jgi:ABC-2 type transport system ATP-binding protein